jgi:hypothetical protein
MGISRNESGMGVDQEFDIPGRGSYTFCKKKG